ncbi:MAG: OsmC family protein [Geothrix sp.]|jgi:organic hydroperoxide reductase OsmC/OhrA|uniref:OsmC family protein n=1 Tax=Candidatus Geothrix odensensis TaxID=2954440 RepID=A0A936F302_9BACT|nr:OsmC family protein [Candidatus Geothrix odensensis]MBP7616878.1 OsmC family protein [Geothrix sp.]MCC6513867.1 OsmC family protein [Geothrix sp.]
MAHHYPLQLHWTGNTLDGTYNRNATVTTAGKQPLAVSSAPEYVGDATRWNPEDLLGTALATCHMLTFLALCAKAKVEVVGYEDHAEAILDTVDKVTRVTQVHLRPVIRVTRGTSMAKVVELFEKAHKYCFVANSVTCEAVLAPRVVEV